MAKPKKKKFEVTEQQTIDAVLQQMKEEGYMVIQGKVSRAKFEECYCYKGPKSQTG